MGSVLPVVCFVLAVALIWWTIRRARKGVQVVQSLMAQVEAHAQAEANAVSQSGVSVAFNGSHSPACGCGAVKAEADPEAQRSGLTASLPDQLSGSPLILPPTSSGAYPRKEVVLQPHHREC